VRALRGSLTPIVVPTPTLDTRSEGEMPVPLSAISTTATFPSVVVLMARLRQMDRLVDHFEQLDRCRSDNRVASSRRSCPYSSIRSSAM